MSKQLLSRQSLAERWDIGSPRTIESYEYQGIITRVKGIPTPRYSLDEIEKIELSGEINPLSPIERKRLERRIEQLENEVQSYRQKFERIKQEVN